MPTWTSDIDKVDSPTAAKGLAESDAFVGRKWENWTFIPIRSQFLFLQQFRKRYKEWDDPHNETGPFHYGAHYSSAMIVCSYLVRLEPFTQQFLQLQGGHFDLADRLFHSIREAWWSAAQLNMADVKELIPEFFYLPDFLVNANRFDLGCKQGWICPGRRCASSLG